MDCTDEELAEVFHCALILSGEDGSYFKPQEAILLSVKTGSPRRAVRGPPPPGRPAG